MRPNAGFEITSHALFVTLTLLDPTKYHLPSEALPMMASYQSIGEHGLAGKDEILGVPLAVRRQWSCTAFLSAASLSHVVEIGTNYANHLIKSSRIYLALGNGGG